MERSKKFLNFLMRSGTERVLLRIFFARSRTYHRDRPHDTPGENVNIL